jgi:hypothetical protein
MKQIELITAAAFKISEYKISNNNTLDQIKYYDLIQRKLIALINTHCNGLKNTTGIIQRLKELVFLMSPKYPIPGMKVLKYRNKLRRNIYYRREIIDLFNDVDEIERPIDNHNTLDNSLSDRSDNVDDQPVQPMQQNINSIDFENTDNQEPLSIYDHSNEINNAHLSTSINLQPQKQAIQNNIMEPTERKPTILTTDYYFPLDNEYDKYLNTNFGDFSQLD